VGLRRDLRGASVSDDLRRLLHDCHQTLLTPSTTMSEPVVVRGRVPLATADTSAARLRIFGVPTRLVTSVTRSFPIDIVP
jgi:hypothetical protein